MQTLLQIDQNILLFIQEHVRQEWMDGFWTAITHLGDAGMIWIALAIILLIPKKTRRAGIAALIALAVGALITNAALKNIVERTRPYEAIPGLVRLIEAQSDFSFPSGHTCASFAAAFALYKEDLEGPLHCPGGTDLVLQALCRSTLSQRRARRGAHRPLCRMGRVEAFQIELFI